MTPRRVDQVLAGFAEGDAISQEARVLQSAFRGMGLASDIFAPPEHVSPSEAGRFRPLAEFASAGADAAILHYATASPATEIFRARSGRGIIRYHNITPSPFFRGFDDGLADQLDAARAALPEIVADADEIWAASEYNAEELRRAGADAVRVVPLFFSLSEFDVPPDPAATRKFAAPLTNFLFMGRVAPNKCVEDLIVAFAWYQRCINPFSRLLLLGSEHSCPPYYAMLRMLAHRLGLPNVCFEGFVPAPVRSACYRLADVFLTASRHEGYCLPLVEAMFHGVPVVARRAGGMPEAMAGAGILFDEEDPRAFAELMHRAATESGLRESVLARQAARVEAIRSRDITEECRQLLRCGGE